MFSPVSTCFQRVATVWQRSEALVLCDILMYVATVATKSPKTPIGKFFYLKLEEIFKNIYSINATCVLRKRWQQWQQWQHLFL